MCQRVSLQSKPRLRISERGQGLGGEERRRGSENSRTLPTGHAFEQGAFEKPNGKRQNIASEI